MGHAANGFMHRVPSPAGLERIEECGVKHKSLVAFGCLLCALHGMSAAYDLSDSLEINGFGTLGLSTNDSDEIQFKSYAGQLGSVGKGEFNAGINDVVGLQGRYRFTDALSLTAQGVLQYIDQDVWDGDLEWLYLAYETPWNLSLRAGKFRFPLFRSSELTYVGYARLYTRPPLVFYGVGGYEHLVGGQIHYSIDFPGAELGVQASYGQAENDLPQLPNGNYDQVESDDVKILSVSLESARFWVHVAYTDLTTDLTRILPNRPPNRLGSTKLNMWSAEWQLQLAGFVLDGGYGKGLIDRFQPDEEVFYSSISRLIGRFTPYLLYSSKQFSSGIPPPSRGALPLGSERTDEIYSLGVRYDWKPGLALKLQADRFQASAIGGASNNLSGEQGSHNALTLVLDWMF